MSAAHPMTVNSCAASSSRSPIWLSPPDGDLIERVGERPSSPDAAVQVTPLPHRTCDRPGRVRSKSPRQQPQRVTNLDQFEAFELSTWRTRIVINEGALRCRIIGGAATLASRSKPEHQAYAWELHRMVEAAVDMPAGTVSSRPHAPGRRGLEYVETGLGWDWATKW